MAQELTFQFEVTLDGVTSAPHVFGLRDDALGGLDHHDLPTPPPVPDAPFATYLAMFDPPADLPNQWLHDFRPVVNLLNDRVEMWQMDLAAAAVGGNCTITVTETQPGLAPYQLNFFGPGADFPDITLPGSLSFPVSSPFLVFFWELRLSDEVDAVNASWGGVKSLYH
ncbi:MAG: hypothetical protein ABFS42_08985 [Candidatus Krumholzibacteriota bacterium]